MNTKLFKFRFIKTKNYANFLFFWAKILVNFLKNIYIRM